MIDETKTAESERMSLRQMFCAANTPTDRRNNRRFTYWCIAWAVTLIGATWMIKNVEAVSGVGAWLIALVPNVFALGALVAYMRFLRMTDELQRRIQVEGLAVGFGIGWIFAIGYQVMEAAGAPELPITAMILVLTGGWVLGTLLAIGRYR